MSNMAIMYVIYTLTGISALFGACSSQCTDAQVDVCVLPMARFNLSNAPVVPSYSEKEIKELCSTYEGVEQCLGSLFDSCDPITQRTMKVIDNQYDYICDKTMDEYLQFRECLSKEGLHTDAERCATNYKDEISALNKSNFSDEYRLQRLCQYANQYITCVATSVQGYCGLQAAEWQRDLDKLTALPTFQLINCPFYLEASKAFTPTITKDKTETNIIIAAVVVVGSVCVVMAAGLVALYISRRRKADRDRAAAEIMRTRRDPHPRHHHRGGERLDAPAPPPYAEKELPPPSYRGPPNYDAVFNNMDLGASGVSHDNSSIPQKA